MKVSQSKKSQNTELLSRGLHLMAHKEWLLCFPEGKGGVAEPLVVSGGKVSREWVVTWLFFVGVGMNYRVILCAHRELNAILINQVSIMKLILIWKFHFIIHSQINQYSIESQHWFGGGTATNSSILTDTTFPYAILFLKYENVLNYFQPTLYPESSSS